MVARLRRLVAVVRHIRVEGRQRGTIGARLEFARATVELGAAAVILHETDERVLKLPLSLQLRDDTADALIQFIDHCGINFHAARLESLVLHLGPILRRRWQSP